MLDMSRDCCASDNDYARNHKLTKNTLIIGSNKNHSTIQQGKMHQQFNSSNSKKFANLYLSSSASVCDVRFLEIS